jgi:regulation of enolase protein 1 (concanavalin A-like superfamily)
MMRSGVRLGGMLVLASLIAAADPPRQIAGWGRVIDPDGDCKVTLEDEKLRIEVPGNTHDLSVELKLLNAPRVLRDIDGDFIAFVRVTGDLRPGNTPTVENRLPYNGAGLLLWQDDANYFRLERAAIFRDGGVFPYVNFELRKNGVDETSDGTDAPNEPIWLRLERRRGSIFGAFSTDGKEWIPAGSLDGEMQGKVRLGVAAINTTTDPYTAQLQGFEVYVKEQPKP